MLRKRELASPRDEPPNSLSTTLWSALKPYIYIQATKQTPQVIFTYACTHSSNGRGEEAINLRVGELQEGLGERCLRKSIGTKRKGEKDVIMF